MNKSKVQFHLDCKYNIPQSYTNSCLQTNEIWNLEFWQVQNLQIDGSTKSGLNLNVIQIEYFILIVA